MFKTKLSRNALLLPWLIAVVGLGSTSVAATESQGSTNEEPQRVAQSTQFSDDELESFVEARQRVAEISSEWQPRMEEAESQEKINALQKAAQEEMVQAVQDEGLTVNDYNTIVGASQNDPELLDRINELMTQ